MKVCSLIQPWATLVVIGAKERETRSWPTSYRGPIAIHASAGMPKWAKDACRFPPIQEALSKAGYKTWRDLPRGAILGVSEITGVQRIGPENTPPAPEVYFGDYTPGRYQWFLGPARALPAPIPAKGSLGLWDTDLVRAEPM